MSWLTALIYCELVRQASGEDGNMARSTCTYGVAFLYDAK